MRLTKIFKALAYDLAAGFFVSLGLATVYPQNVTFVRVEDSCLFLLLLVGGVQYWRRWRSRTFHKLAARFYEEMEPDYHDFVIAQVRISVQEAIAAVTANLMGQVRIATEQANAGVVANATSTFDNMARERIQWFENDIVSLALAMYRVSGPLCEEGPEQLLARIKNPKLLAALRPVRTIESVCLELAEARAKRNGAVDSQRNSRQKVVDLLKAELALLAEGLEALEVPAQLAAAREERATYEPGSLPYAAAD